jgi:hypothetical protein
MIPFDVEDEDPQTQISFAAMWGDLIRIKLAIRSGADVNGKCDGSSPLHDACIEGKVFAARFLMRIGADIDCQDDSGRTPLMCIIEGGILGSIPEELLLRGANPNISNENGDTAIQLAVYHNLRGVVELLLNNGAIDRRDVPCWEKKASDDYHNELESINQLFHDDRMFVFEVAPVTTRRHDSQHRPQKEWAVITRRNVPGYPGTHTTTFLTRSEAVTYYRKVVVGTPRISLDQSSPNPKPSLNEYTSWLKEENYYDQLLNPEAPIVKDGGGP